MPTMKAPWKAATTRPHVTTVCPACKIERCSNCSIAEEYGLTHQELVVVRKVCDGLTNRQIADDLQISEETVKRHITNILIKAGADNRTHLAVMALRRGWASLLATA